MAAKLSPRWSLVDIGLNLTDSMYQGNYHHGSGSAAHASDMECVLQRASAVGVRGMLVTGGNVRESTDAVELARKYTTPSLQLYSTVGCHPTRCSEFLAATAGPDEYLQQLLSLIEDNTKSKGGVVAAVGECGLDYDRLHFCPADTQKRFFEAQFELTRRFHLPMFLHSRNCADDFERIVRSHRSDFSHGVVHSFTGSMEELAQLLDLGLYIGVNGCSLKTPENLEAVKSIPLDRVLIETDAPWCELKNTHASRQLLDARSKSVAGGSVSAALLAPFPVVRKEKFVMGAMVKSRNEPCTLVEVLEVLYWLHNDESAAASVEEVRDGMSQLAARISQNTAELFGFTTP